ncbi:very-short-patch-repair endonuclease [Streptomyces atratus]
MAGLGRTDVGQLSEIRTADLDGETIYSAWDACRILGYRQSEPSARIPDRLKRRVKWAVFGETGSRAEIRTTAMTLGGLKFLVARSRKTTAWDLAAELGVELVYAPLPQAETLRIIKAALAPVEFVEEYTVGPFTVDAYLPGLNVVIECDEHGHETYRQSTEWWRQTYVQDQLKCVFVRFNPHEVGFNIGSVINEILTMPLPKKAEQSA